MFGVLDGSRHTWRAHTYIHVYVRWYVFVYVLDTTCIFLLVVYMPIKDAVALRCMRLLLLSAKRRRAKGTPIEGGISNFTPMHGTVAIIHLCRSGISSALCDHEHCFDIKGVMLNVMGTCGFSPLIICHPRAVAFDDDAFLHMCVCACVWVFLRFLGRASSSGAVCFALLYDVCMRSASRGQLCVKCAPHCHWRPCHSCPCIHTQKHTPTFAPRHPEVSLCGKIRPRFWRMYEMCEMGSAAAFEWTIMARVLPCVLHGHCTLKSV